MIDRIAQGDIHMGFFNIRILRVSFFASAEGQVFLQARGGSAR